jgi:uncharacterized membrane protein
MTPGMTTAADTAIADYLDDLRDELADLPGDRRRELVREIEAHIGQARSQLDDPFSEADVRTLLERLGPPAEIASEARDGEAPARVVAPSAPATASWHEPAAIVLLLIGGFVIVGWPVGVVLLWSSPRWSVIDKLVGTFVLPGGLVASTFVIQTLVTVSECSPPCNGDGSGGSTVGAVLVWAATVSPLLTTVYLSLRLRRTS